MKFGEVISACMLSLSLLLLFSMLSTSSLAIDAPAASIVIQGTSATINVTYTEKVGLSEMKITLLPSTTIPINNKPPIKSTFSCGQGDFAYFMSQSLRFSGNYTFYIRVVDCAGNFREDYRNFSVVIPPPKGCGDRFVNSTLAEECDDGNVISGDGCSSFCKRETCANNRIDFGEVCDGSELNEYSCSSFPGYISGSLACSADCKRLVFSSCTPDPDNDCGNGVIDLGEQCDGLNWGSISSCTQFDSAFTGGQLACSPQTCTFNTSNCAGKQNAICGNSQIEVGEQCDGVVRKKCSDFDNFFGSSLSCSSNCGYNTSRCQKPAPKCGDGEINTDLNENCDGSSLLQSLDSCSDFTVFSSSNSLRCKLDCSLDTSGCELRQNLTDTCTNGKKDAFETGVDCGGACGCCEDSKICSSNSDCCSGFCSSGTCAEASCSDGMKNGYETDVDCGGFCEQKCDISKSCESASDCVTSFCSGSTCQEPSCTDGVKNGLETDVDCGSGCESCSIGQVCAYSADCSSNMCEYGFCAVDKLSDVDFDQMPDFWEDLYGLDKNNPSDANKDFDKDKLTNLEEYFNGTDPTVFDGSAKKSSLGIFLWISGLVILILSSGFLFYYRNYLKQVPYARTQVSQGATNQLKPQATFQKNYVSPVSNLPNKNSQFIRRLVLQKKAAKQEQSKSNISQSQHGPQDASQKSASKESDVFEKLGKLNSESKKEKKNKT